MTKLQAEAEQVEASQQMFSEKLAEILARLENVEQQLEGMEKPRSVRSDAQVLQ